MIALQDCKHGWTYKIHSRNLVVGVFNKERNGFVGIREKFGSRYLFMEYHWDTGAPHGTVKPEREIEECPVKDLRESFDMVCFKCDDPVHFVKKDPVKGTGDWEHVRDPSTCPKIVTSLDNWGSPKNKDLFDYLEKIEKSLEISK